MRGSKSNTPITLILQFFKFNCHLLDYFTRIFTFFIIFIYSFFN